MKATLVLILMCLGLTACQTGLKDFNDVKVGMEKDEVLGKLGSPDRRQRWKGKDRWTYIYYDTRTRSEHEIHFQEGLAVYVGDKYVPPVSADAQDILNDESNREVEAMVLQRRKEAMEGLDNYERENSPSEDSYVPSYEPVR